MLSYSILLSQKSTLLLIPYHFTISSTSQNSIFIKILFFNLSLLFFSNHNFGFPRLFQTHQHTHTHKHKPSNLKQSHTHTHKHKPSNLKQSHTHTHNPSTQKNPAVKNTQKTPMINPEKPSGTKTHWNKNLEKPKPPLPTAHQNPTGKKNPY